MTYNASSFHWEYKLFSSLFLIMTIIINIIIHGKYNYIITTIENMKTIIT